MSLEDGASFLSLPTELLHCILDRLDTEEILFSFRNVCTSFRETTDNYKLYEIHIASNSAEADIHHLCRMIRPENVVSLVLTNAHPARQRIELFLSLIDISRFTRLRSVDLYGADASHLNRLLPHLSTVSTFTSLSLRAHSTDTDSNDIIDALPTIIAMSHLRKLRLRRFHPTMEELLSSKQSKLEELTIDCTSHRDLFYILHHLPHLRAFSSNLYEMNEFDPFIPPTSFPRLTSLTLRCSVMIIEQIESLLSSTPALARLHIISQFLSFRCLTRFSRWEQFIRQNLPLLKQLHFFFKTLKWKYEKIKDVELLLQAFRTPFWLEQKRWYVTCTYANDETRSDLLLYSSRQTLADFPDNLPASVLSYSNSTAEGDDDDAQRTVTKWTVRLNVSEFTNVIASNEANQPTSRIFDHMRQLALDIDWPMNSFDLLSTVADFSGLEEIWLFLSGFHCFESEMLGKLLDLAPHLQTLGICYDNESTLIPEDVCDVISRRVNHLKVKTTELECIQTVLKYVRNVPCITFICHHGASKSWLPVIEWLNGTEFCFSRSKDYSILRVHNMPPFRSET